jgi:hypothetical protein
MDEKELKKFIEKVSRNCPADAKKLLEMINEAEGDKDQVFRTIDKTGTKSVTERGGIR